VSDEPLVISGRGPSGCLDCAALAAFAGSYVSMILLGPTLESWLGPQQVLFLNTHKAVMGAWVVVIVILGAVRWRLVWLRRRQNVRVRLDAEGLRLERRARPDQPVLAPWNTVQGYSLRSEREVLVELEGARPTWTPKVAIPTQDEATRQRVVDFLDRRGVRRLG
jgi:hypothetical protein